MKRMRNFLLMDSDFPTRVVLEDIAKCADAWDWETRRQSHPQSYHKDTKCIFLRRPSELSLESMFNELRCVDDPNSYKIPTARAIMWMSLADLHPCELGRVMLVSLKPGGHIPPHIDEGAYADYYNVRLHLCLQSGAGCDFKCGTETIWMKPGELWQFNHKEQHEVTNNWYKERIHMILDVRKLDS